jgi:hypothetical protein
VRAHVRVLSCCLSVCLFPPLPRSSW